jgi:ribosomal protein S18 acetylase RimI-like enzyme
MSAEIRPARPADQRAIERVVHDAYGHYVARMGQRPGPMDDDYAARIAGGEAWVLDDTGSDSTGSIAGALVLRNAVDHLLLDNIAVAPAHQGKGVGRRLMAFAEAEARRRGHAEIRLYTHETMVENQALYRHLGFVETHRAEQAGFRRVFMRKTLS